MRCAVVLGCAVLVASGCSESRQGQPLSRATDTAAAATITLGGTITGTVREQITVDPYVNVRLETA